MDIVTFWITKHTSGCGKGNVLCEHAAHEERLSALRVCLTANDFACFGKRTGKEGQKVPGKH